MWFLEMRMGEEELEEGDRKVKTFRYYKKRKKILIFKTSTAEVADVHDVN